jgi:Ulp1 family protease
MQKLVMYNRSPEEWDSIDLYFPVNFVEHWWAVILSPSKGTIEFYDGLDYDIDLKIAAKFFRLMYDSPKSFQYDELKEGRRVMKVSCNTMHIYI